ncbi:MAG: hypothetical protein Phog2KO_41120 [Phototrophicaceae bacterium]
MSHARPLTWSLLILSLFTIAVFSVQAIGFDPVINMLGFTSTSDVGEEIEWIITFSNTGDTAGQNIVISDTVGNGLQVENVQHNTGTTSINGRTVTVSIPMLNPDETIQFSIFTTVIDASDMSNTVCVTASNLNGENCVRGLPVQALPATGETPYWREPTLWLGVMTLSVSLLVIGLGLLGFQSMQVQDDIPLN